MTDSAMDAYCKSMDKAFMDYMCKKIDDRTLCKRLSAFLHQMSVQLKFPKEFEVIIIDGKNEFLGICTYPDISGLSKVFTNLDETSGSKFCRDWIVDIDKYVIEIDKNCFDKNVIGFTNQEMTAMLLHELSHVAFSNKKSEIIYNSYKINQKELKSGEKNAIRASQRILYTIPAMIACGTHTIMVGKNGEKEEYICDQIFGITDYKVHLHSAINKIIKAYGNTIFMNTKTSEQKIDGMVKWCNLNISELTVRREKLKSDLIYQSAGTHSKSIRALYIDIMKKLNIGLADKYTYNQVAFESIFSSIDSGEIPISGLFQQYTPIDTDRRAVAAFESTIKSSLAMEGYKTPKAPELPSDYDIDIISIEIDRINNNYDRMYVLDLIYNKIDQIMDYMEYNEHTANSNRNKSKCQSQLKTLEKLRLAVLNTRPPRNDLKLLVNYPKGYEG